MDLVIIGIMWFVHIRINHSSKDQSDETAGTPATQLTSENQVEDFGTFESNR